MDMHKERFLKALESKYVAKKDNALATLALYLDGNRLSAIGEHSEIQVEQDKWLGEYLDATDKLKAIEEIKGILQTTDKSDLLKS